MLEIVSAVILAIGSVIAMVFYTASATGNRKKSPALQDTDVDLIINMITGKIEPPKEGEMSLKSKLREHYTTQQGGDNTSHEVHKYPKKDENH